MATYTARKTDTGAYLSATLGDLLTYATAVRFVGKHQTDATAKKIDEVGVIDAAGGGTVHVVLNCTGLRVGVYDCCWEAADSGGLLWARPSAGGETLEILGSLR